MERLIIKYPIVILLIWILLNFLHHFLNFLNISFCKNTAIDFNLKLEAKYNKKFFLKLLLWLVFGIGTLAALRQAMLEKELTAYECLIWFGAFFFLMIGYLLNDLITLQKYFVYRRMVPKLATYSLKASILIYSFEFFGYSVLLLISFLISQNPVLLGGSIGVAFGAILYLLELTRKKNYSKIEEAKK